MKEGYVLIYDVTVAHAEVKSEMTKKGYSEAWKMDGKIFSLPHNCLFVQKEKESDADRLKNLSLIIEEIRAVIKSLNVGREKKIGLSATFAFPSRPWSGTNVLDQLVAPEWTDATLIAFNQFQANYLAERPNASKEMVSLAFLNHLEFLKKEGSVKTPN